MNRNEAGRFASSEPVEFFDDLVNALWNEFDMYQKTEPELGLKTIFDNRKRCRRNPNWTENCAYKWRLEFLNGHEVEIRFFDEETGALDLVNCFSEPGGIVDYVEIHLNSPASMLSSEEIANEIGAAMHDSLDAWRREGE